VHLQASAPDGRTGRTPREKREPPPDEFGKPLAAGPRSVATTDWPTCGLGRAGVLVIHDTLSRMTMLSFRVPDDDAAAIQQWAEALGVDRSEILRDAVHRHLVVLETEADAERWQQQPATDAERSLEAIADWGPAEDWSDWNDAAR
jgi:predicted transcriptional regulator